LTYKCPSSSILNVYPAGSTVINAPAQQYGTTYPRIGNNIWQISFQLPSTLCPPNAPILQLTPQITIQVTADVPLILVLRTHVSIPHSSSTSQNVNLATSCSDPSGPLVHVCNANWFAPTTLTLSPCAPTNTAFTLPTGASSTYGNAITFSVDVTSSSVVNEGSVIFSVSSTTDANFTTIQQAFDVSSTGTASFPLSGTQLETGTYTITATYSDPSNNFEESTATFSPFTVNTNTDTGLCSGVTTFDCAVNFAYCGSCGDVYYNPSQCYQHYTGEAVCAIAGSCGNTACSTDLDCASEVVPSVCIINSCCNGITGGICLATCLG